MKDIISAEYKNDYKIEITFQDGRSGIVDFEPYKNQGGVFTKFQDIQFFQNFKVNPELGTLTWNDEIDIAPEVLYAKATQSPLPKWMEAEHKSSIDI